MKPWTYNVGDHIIDSKGCIGYVVIRRRTGTLYKTFFYDLIPRNDRLLSRGESTWLKSDVERTFREG